MDKGLKEGVKQAEKPRGEAAKSQEKKEVKEYDNVPPPSQRPKEPKQGA